MALTCLGSLAACSLAVLSDQGDGSVCRDPEIVVDVSVSSTVLSGVFIGLWIWVVKVFKPAISFVLLFSAETSCAH